jgi:hypothetical protein
MAYDPLDAGGDSFRPPEIPTLVFCLHCRQEYDSYRIEWRVLTNADGKPHGFWCCPIPGCGGLGFGCDIFPVDPDYQDERGGWVHDDDGDANDDADSRSPFEGEQDSSDDDEGQPV